MKCGEMEVFMKKRIISWLVIFSLIIPMSLTTYTAETSTDIQETEIAERIEQMVALCSSDYVGQYNVGDAISIYNADTACTYYIIPVFCDQECIGVIELDSIGNITLNHSSTLYTEITELPSSTYLLYTSGGIVFADLNGEVIELYDSKFNIPLNAEFTSLSFASKLSTIEMSLEESANILNVSSVITNVELASVIESETSPFAVVPTVVLEKCSITNFVTQGDYNICWAACVATIANFKNGYSLTAADVATAMNHDYASMAYIGATPAETISALSLYGLSYSITSAKISWANVKSNIINDKPFIISVYSSSTDEGHALTGYGYATSYGDTDASSRYVEIWDPNGSKLSWQYNASSYSLYGYSWTWMRTYVD